jgi:hypothetical protein
MASIMVHRQVQVVETNGIRGSALVVYGKECQCGQTVTIHRCDDHFNKIQVLYGTVAEHRAGDGVRFYAASFPVLVPGHYVVWEPATQGAQSAHGKSVTVTAGAMAEVSFV